VIDLTYKFVVAPDAKLAGDYRVFVHLNREDGTDDLERRPRAAAQYKTSTWQPGQDDRVHADAVHADGVVCRTGHRRDGSVPRR
jgi:hypothetical protein